MVTALALPCQASAPSRVTVNIRLNDTISSGSSQAGDSFTGTLDGPLVVGDRIVADRGTQVIGRITEVVSSGRTKTAARLTLRLQSVHAVSNIPMRTGDLTVKAGSDGTRNLLIIGGSAALGSVIGAASGGGKGAIIGAAAGGGAGTIGAYLSGKNEIVLPAETRLTFHVTSVVISPGELARLQRPVAPAYGDIPPIVVYRERHHHHEDDDDEDEEEHEHEHRHFHGEGYEFESEDECKCERPRTIDVVFHGGHRAIVVIAWPQRVERLTFDGDDLDDILEPLSAHTRISIEILRPRIHVRRDDD
jgi:hypothetical protein